MAGGSGLLLVGAVAAVGVLHPILPDPWVPITLIVRQRGWSGLVPGSRSARGVTCAAATDMATVMIMGTDTDILTTSPGSQRQPRFMVRNFRKSVPNTAPSRYPSSRPACRRTFA